MGRSAALHQHMASWGIVGPYGSMEGARHQVWPHLGWFLYKGLQLRHVKKIRDKLHLGLRWPKLYWNKQQSTDSWCSWLGDGDGKQGMLKLADRWRPPLKLTLERGFFLQKLNNNMVGGANKEDVMSGNVVDER